MNFFKKVMLFMLMLVCCSTLTSCKYIEGTSSIAIRVGMDSSNKFSEAVSTVPVGEKSSVTSSVANNSNMPSLLMSKTA